ncbi:ATP-binding cassette domain-containing protein [bacterium]|nr:ATP-binding cassette domain-containing protein [bacterium]
MMKVLEMRGLARAYERGRNVLEDLDLTIEAGEVIGLLGRNGAGKTTLLRLALGLLEPQHGEVKVFGLDPQREPEAVKRRVGYVAEDQILPGFLRVHEVIDLHRRLYPGWDEELAAELASRFHMRGDQRIKQLSKGQARQVALLCAVAHRPSLLLLDEPAGGLDPAMRREFLETAIQLLGESGTAIVFSSHHMTDVERLASRLVMLHDSQKWIDSALDDVREGYCLALAPLADGVSARAMLAQADCLSARERDGTVRAIFELDPEACRRRLEREFSPRELRCLPLPLEEMFIELVGRGGWS